MNLYLLKYNNYYNRIVKKFNTLSEYLVTPYYNNDVVENVNFNPNDGVDTIQIVNSNGKFDYCILSDGNDIISRWFILECKRERNGQHRLTLRRDLVVDNYQEIINAPTFIEKATVSNSDPAIFNNENMGFNQIKTQEIPIKDETNSAWVVGYIPRDSFAEDTQINATANLKDTADITVDNLINWDMYQYTTTPFKGDYEGSTRIVGYFNADYTRDGVNFSTKTIGFGSDNAQVLDPGPINNQYIFPGINTPTSPGYTLTNNALLEGTERSQVTTLRNLLAKNWFNNFDSYLEQSRAYTGCHTRAQTLEFQNLNGKIIYESSTGLYRRIVINSTFIEDEITDINAGAMFDNLNSGVPKDLGNYGRLAGSPNATTFKVKSHYTKYTISLEQVPSAIKTTLNSNRYHLEDQPYDMFCIPYSETLAIYKNGTKLFNSNKSLAVNMAVEIGAKSGDKNIYDIQLLPYCPVRYCILEDGTFDIGNAQVNYITNAQNENIGVILWATTSQFTVDIPYTITIDDYKVDNECNKYRLVSPNYSGQFEFSAAKNGGVQSFNVDCSYKPYNPYIHINPNFGRLYGQDFNDARGLICGGDFSLPQVTNAWANYQQNNKNFQNIFDRQIENMEFNNKMSNIQSGIGAATGALSAGVTAGAVFGPIGGAISGLLSAAGGAADIAINKALQNEALDYKKDMFGYELGNIKAMPTGLAKTSAFTYNNKIFPILEYYTCTDEEKQALKDKIKYNGMTVMRVGKIVDFLQQDYSYIKGKVIRLESISDDTNYLNQIADEINKGVFIK